MTDLPSCWRGLALALPLALPLGLAAPSPVAAAAAAPIAGVGLDGGGEAPARLAAPEPGGAGAEPAPAADPGPPPGEAADGGGLRAWLEERLSTLEDLLARSGLDVEALIERAAATDADGLTTGQGGPLVPALGPDAPRAPAAGAELADGIERLQRVRRLIAAAPLAAPMETYRLNSGFGYRRDPFTRKGAVHEGQDFGGPRDAAVLATAPGTVVEAGRAGAYGITVAIDHGMGIRTRYAHLRKALVRAGQRVDARQRIAVMGSTGRSTGPHLHYEVRVDDRPLDPLNFLAAGGQLLQLVGG